MVIYILEMTGGNHIL